MLLTERVLFKGELLKKPQFCFSEILNFTVVIILEQCFSFVVFECMHEFDKLFISEVNLCLDSSLYVEAESEKLQTIFS